MRFEVCSTRHWYVDQTIDDYPCLNNYGLEVVKGERRQNSQAFITINNLHDLSSLEQDVGHSLILCDGKIEIYDDYRE